ncbi:hypothetical protein [uncultured Amnibacterium sp.]|uniref:hypothetical protein n=1 Tax=uncultured Amnibacterium sp. TaxID=1631851 RepID=UPI0035C9F3D5
MTTTSLRDRQRLQEELERVLEERPTGRDLVDLVIRAGRQARPLPDPNSELLGGVLEDGRRVPIEIRRASRRRRG